MANPVALRGWDAANRGSRPWRPPPGLQVCDGREESADRQRVPGKEFGTVSRRVSSYTTRS